jgi:putative ABC transport system permease protein
MEEKQTIPEQTPVSWAIVLSVSLAGLRRRFARAMITMAGVVLAIAFLCYMLVNESIIRAMIALSSDDLNIMLQNANVDIFSGGRTDKMTLLLIGLTLLTSLVGIINAMLMAVTERVKEIGTLKCLGATDHFVVRAYFIESTIQGVCGSVLGLLIGLIVALGVSARTYGMYTFTTFPVSGVLFSLLVSLSAGVTLSVLAAIIPAYMAAKKQPVEALRVEE